MKSPFSHGFLSKLPLNITKIHRFFPTDLYIAGRSRAPQGAAVDVHAPGLRGRGGGGRGLRSGAGPATR